MQQKINSGIINSFKRHYRLQRYALITEWFRIWDELVPEHLTSDVLSVTKLCAQPQRHRTSGDFDCNGRMETHTWRSSDSNQHNPSPRAWCGLAT